MLQHRCGGPDIRRLTAKRKIVHCGKNLRVALGQFVEQGRGQEHRLDALPPNLGAQLFRIEQKIVMEDYQASAVEKSAPYLKPHSVDGRVGGVPQNFIACYTQVRV